MDLGPRVGVGRTADVYALDEDRVVKLYGPGTPTSAVADEAERTRAAADCDVPVPAVHGTTTVDGRPGVVFERVDGLPVADELAERPWRIHRIGGTLARLHARVHACEPTGLPRFVERVRDALGDDAVPRDLREAALGALDDIPEGTGLLHGDFHPANVLDADGKRVVIDWVDAAVGDPAADVARSLVVLRSASTADATLQGRVEAWVLRRYRRAYRRAYVAGTDVSEDRVRAWLPVLAAARLAEVSDDGLESFARGRFRRVD